MSSLYPTQPKIIPKQDRELVGVGNIRANVRVKNLIEQAEKKRDDPNFTEKENISPSGHKNSLLKKLFCVAVPDDDIDPRENRTRKFFWDAKLEHTFLECIRYLENDGLESPNIFAISGVQDEIDSFHIDLGKSIPENTDVDVVASVMKNIIRYVNEPLITMQCLEGWESAGLDTYHHQQRASLPSFEDDFVSDTSSVFERPKSLVPFKRTHIYRVLCISEEISTSRGYLLARFLQLLGRISSHDKVNKMSTYNLSFCLTPSVFQWIPATASSIDQLSIFSNTLTTLIEESRLHMESLVNHCKELELMYYSRG